MAWVDSLQLAYLAADDQVRRLPNQADFREVFIGPDGVMRVEYTDGIVDLVVDDLQEWVKQVGDTSEDNIEAVTETDQRYDNEIRPGRRTRAYHRRSFGHGWNVKRLVEVSGLEPPTSTLRTWRSTQGHEAVTCGYRGPGWPCAPLRATPVPLPDEVRTAAGPRTGSQAGPEPSPALGPAARA
jgi:hypothetical protein